MYIPIEATVIRVYGNLSNMKESPKKVEAVNVNKYLMNRIPNVMVCLSNAMIDLETIHSYNAKGVFIAADITKSGKLKYSLYCNNKQALSLKVTKASLDKGCYSYFIEVVEALGFEIQSSNPIYKKYSKLVTDIIASNLQQHVEALLGVFPFTGVYNLSNFQSVSKAPINLHSDVESISINVIQEDERVYHKCKGIGVKEIETINHILAVCKEYKYNCYLLENKPYICKIRVYNASFAYESFTLKLRGSKMPTILETTRRLKETSFIISLNKLINASNIGEF